MGQAYMKECERTLPVRWTPEMEKILKEFMIWFEAAYEQV